MTARTPTGAAQDGGVVVVGAGLGAIRLAEALRANGYTEPITLVGGEPHPPYDRPPLSKAVLLGKDERVDLKPPEFYTDADIRLCTDSWVTAVDSTTKAITVSATPSGTTDQLSYDILALATGLAPRTFPGPGGDLAGVHLLRTFDDARAIRDEIDGARRGAVIGAGFIGCEVAASLASRGLAVTLIDPAPTPLAAGFGEEIGELVARMHRDEGIEVRMGVGVSELVGDSLDDASALGGRVRAVVLDDGTEVPADLVVVGIGSQPVVDYLDGSGIALADPQSGGGVACDEVGRTNVDGVYALGDVANWADGSRRVEHWNHTVEQAAVVAHQIAGRGESVPAVPYFWSDQFDLKIQLLGSPHPDDEVHIVDDSRKFLAYYSRNGILTGVIGAGKVGAVMRTRAKLQTPTPIADVLTQT